MSDEAVGQPPPDGPAGQEPAMPDRPAPKSDEVESLLDLVRNAYARRGQHLSLKKSRANKVKSQLELDDPARAEISRLATEDPLLAVPPQLLAAVDQPDIPAPVRRAALDVVRDVLRQHPLFKAEVVQQVLAGVEHAGLAEAMGTLSGLTDDEFARRLPLENPKPKQVREARANALGSLAYSVALRRGMADTELALTLNEHLWAPASVEARRTSTKAPLVVSDGPEALGALAHAWQQLLDHASEQVDDAELAARVAAQEVAASAQRAEAAEQARRALADELDQATQRIADLQLALAQAEQAHREGQTHASYDYETLRARLTWRLKREVDVLHEGLHALRRDPPKTHVMEDRAQRVIDGLEAELRDLEKGGGT